MDFGFGPEEALNIDLDLGHPPELVCSIELPVSGSLLTLSTASVSSEVPVTPPADVEMLDPVVVFGEQPEEQVVEEKRMRKKKQIFDDLTELDGVHPRCGRLTTPVLFIVFTRTLHCTAFNTRARPCHLCAGKGQRAESSCHHRPLERPRCPSPSETNWCQFCRMHAYQLV